MSFCIFAWQGRAEVEARGREIVMAWHGGDLCSSGRAVGHAGCLYVTFDLQIGRVARLRGRVGGDASVIARVRGG